MLAIYSKTHCIIIHLFLNQLFSFSWSFCTAESVKEPRLRGSKIQRNLYSLIKKISSITETSQSFVLSVMKLHPCHQYQIKSVQEPIENLFDCIGTAILWRNNTTMSNIRFLFQMKYFHKYCIMLPIKCILA